MHPIPKAFAVPVAASNPAAQVQTEPVKTQSEPVRVPVEADAFLRGLFGPNYGTGITDSEPRRSSFKRSSSVRKSVTFTDTPLISTQPTETNWNQNQNLLNSNHMLDKDQNYHLG